MKYGLPDLTVAQICAVLAQYPQVDRAVLYGSRAKGNFKPGSDIDLTLYGADLTQKSPAMPGFLMLIPSWQMPWWYGSPRGWVAGSFANGRHCTRVALPWSW